MVLSQENPETEEWERHDSPREIAQKLGISKNSVYRIVRFDLDLKMKGQHLTELDHKKRIVRSERTLRYFTKTNLRKTFFSDESIFTVEGMYNAHNDVFYTMHTMHMHTMAYFDENLPEQAEILLPEDWPPHSPDLKPMDYCIWSFPRKAASV